MNRIVTRRLLCFLALVLFSVNTSKAAFAPDKAYRSDSIFSTAGLFVALEGLDVDDNHAYLGFGTNVFAVTLSNETSFSIGTLPPNVTVSYLALRTGDLHAAYGQNFTSPFPSRYGYLDESGVFQDEAGLDGIYDAAVDSSGTLYIMANPDALGSKIFRYIAASNSIEEVIHVGGFSGGIAFDRNDRLYVAEQTFGDEKIIRYTQAQLTAGGLAASNGTAVVSIGASYMCFDDQNNLYVVSGFGNQLTMFDSETGALIRTVASDDVFGYGIGRIAWDSTRNELLVIYTDYGPYFSTLNRVAFGFAPAASGVAGTSAVFKGWIRDYRDFTRPNLNSGGLARDDDLAIVTPGEAIIGRPANFGPGSEVSPAGHFLSLGNGGSIILEFDDVIVNGPGDDFAVFENAFIDDSLRPGVTGEFTFAEFAFVEVGTTTNDWARFPVTYYGTSIIYNLNNAVSNFYASQDVKLVDGVAGKNISAFGTPFDLAKLAGHPSVTNGTVDLNQIAFIRIVDAIGDGSTFDSEGRAIYDPYYHSSLGYPNPAFDSILDGFDLRAVGVINCAGVNVMPSGSGPDVVFYGYTGRSYQVQSSADGNAWMDFGAPVVGTGGVQKVSAATNNVPVGMFRVIQDVP